LALSSEIIHILHLAVVLTGSNWTAKLGIAANLHLQRANSAAKSQCLGCADGKVQAGQAGVVPSLDSHFIQHSALSFLFIKYQLVCY